MYVCLRELLDSALFAFLESTFFATKRSIFVYVKNIFNIMAFGWLYKWLKIVCFKYWRTYFRRFYHRLSIHLLYCLRLLRICFFPISRIKFFVILWTTTLQSLTLSLFAFFFLLPTVFFVIDVLLFLCTSYGFPFYFVRFFYKDFWLFPPRFLPIQSKVLPFTFFLLCCVVQVFTF